MRPIWHWASRRVKAHIFVAALAFLFERMLERALADAGVSLSARAALDALATVRHVSTRILVMYLGEVVESGPSDALTASPLHPYTASLLSAVPEPAPLVEATRERIILNGEVPTPLDPPPACRFHTRCPIGPAVRTDREVCRSVKPLLQDVGGGRAVACHFPGAHNEEPAKAAIPG